jgi:hypothetical protein
MTDITAANLLHRGYREWAGSGRGEERFFQKCFSDADGKRFYLNFREWQFPDRVSFDAELSFDTDDGAAWITLKAPTIEQSEARAETMWAAGGSVYYERSEPG